MARRPWIIRSFSHRRDMPSARAAASSWFEARGWRMRGWPESALMMQGRRLLGGFYGRKPWPAGDGGRNAWYGGLVQLNGGKPLTMVEDHAVA